MASVMQKLNLQGLAHQWEQENFKISNKELKIKLKEEVEELFEALNSDDADVIRDEISDVVLILMMFSERYNRDLLYDAVYKLEFNKRRQWKRNEDGTYSHIKEDKNNDGEEV